jgi:D-alanine-D-alanine ligase
VCGEIIPHHEFYSYEAKYLDKAGAELLIPAIISKQLCGKIQKVAIEAFKVLCCEGMARVDFFLTAKGRIVINEINTIPGFTSISMYPKLWEASGITYSKLIDKLIELAIERYDKEQKLLTSVVK